MKTVAIAGRPNVGKSALFNRLSGTRISIVHDQPGVTRDYISTVCRKEGTPFELIDTGGIGASPDPEFSDQTDAAAQVAVEAADLVLFVVDGPAGLTPTDRDLAVRFRKSGHKVFLVVNKIDTERHEHLGPEFSGLGFPDIFTISAAHGRGVEELRGRILNHLGPDENEAEPGESWDEAPRIALVGRPNVGKSSLVNAILGHERTIVSDIAGTTRDAVDIGYEFKGRRYVLCDTAGIRHRSKHDTSVEVFSVMRSEQAIRRADICILVLDVTQGLTTQDKKIASLIQKSEKPVIVVANKWDLIPADDRRSEGLRSRTEQLHAELFFFNFAPILLASAKTGGQVPKLFRLIEQVRKAASNRIGTGELNRLLRTCIEETPPPSKSGKRLKLLYATQVRGADEERCFHPPAFVLFVNDAELLTPPYEEFLRRKIRAKEPYPGLPVLLRPRGREKRKGS